jgi:hypothetical protein
MKTAACFAMPFILCGGKDEGKKTSKDTGKTSQLYEHLPSCFIDGKVRRERKPLGQ